MERQRKLVIVADDYGLGPETSRAILELGQEGRVTATALLVNAPDAGRAVAAWRRNEYPMELGWHANLTLDAPVLRPQSVPSLVRPDGRFWPLASLVRRLLLCQVNPRDIAAELAAQWQRFVDLVGSPPPLVNSHHHIALFPPVGRILIELLRRQHPAPHFRRVREGVGSLHAIPGARLKRAALSLLGQRLARRTSDAGFPGCDRFAGLSVPSCSRDPLFFVRWLLHTPGGSVELMCHPGYDDATLVGRDGQPGDGTIERRARELQLLRGDSFAAAVRDAGFQLVAPTHRSPSRLAA